MKSIFDVAKIETVSPEASTLPQPIRDWVSRVAAFPLLSESRADCGDCPLRKPPAIDGAHCFTSTACCCTYNPRLSNFQVGAVFSDDDPALEAGRRNLARRIASRRGVTPIALCPDQAEKAIYRKLSDTEQIGQSDELLCPYLLFESRHLCSIWKYRPSACATWFCRHVRGRTGKTYWRALGRLLHAVELTLSHQCLLALDIGDVALTHLFPANRAHEERDLNADAVYPELWGPFRGREIEFFKACATYAAGLSVEDIVALGGPEVRIRLKLFSEAERRLHAASLPDKLIPGRFRAQGDGGKTHVLSYMAIDPVEVPTAVMMMLHCFDGRKNVPQALEDARQMGYAADETVVRTLYDFGLLVRADR